MEYIIFKTPNEYAMEIARNMRKVRQKQKLSMKALAEKSNVSYGSIKRFEGTGQISLTSLLKIAIVLDAADSFEELFKITEIQSIQEIIDGKI